MDSVLDEIVQVCETLHTVSLDPAGNNALGTASATRSTAIEQAIAELENPREITRALVAPPETNSEITCGKVSISPDSGIGTKLT
ncbi:hypothetical protein GSI_06574 [Ganoderma sinense ZZ0214-1]|uniref:Uncharacterized protein n=1 Tax=Ganoderma sinense ZZ0214-1 TaxID=1077348 RepID=A0A2G8SDM3_9APHY|nr:hypothetical protein GSI_06574 [Ganoderma sinense ZZ0214-1]